MADPEQLETPPPDLDRQARVHHHAQQADEQRRRGRIELSIGMLLFVSAMLAIVATKALVSMWGLLIVGTFLVVGVALIATGAVHMLVHLPSLDDADAAMVMATLRKRLVRGWVEVGVGIVGIAAGLAITFTTYKTLGKQLDKYLLAFGPFVAGYAALVRGTLRLLDADKGLVKPASAAGKRNDISVGFGFKTFVAWRYLMARHHKLSRIVLAVFFVALFAAAASLMVFYTVLRPWNPLELDPAVASVLFRVVLITMIAGFALLYFSILIGLLRFVFSFFTTVPIVGVWIGTAALIIVLSVMSGFETDLRQKILGSNAHIQVTAESGDISNWREIMDRISKVPGVVAATPYAVSEVVIAANNNGMNVIIKGIDPETVAKVTKLVQSIKTPDAMKNLEPLVDDTQDLTVPPLPAAGSGSGVVDPPPDDMPGRGEPIDFSVPVDDAAQDDAFAPAREEPDVTGPARAPGSAAAAASPDPVTVTVPRVPAPPTPPVADGPALPGGGDEPYGGDARVLVAERPTDAPVVDPPPPDLVTTDEEPIDYSGATEDLDLPIEVVDVPIEPSLSRRTQSLPGILVGAELVKQTHLYVGEEVRVVSPLSDPANPDATGTPIPFNRDYRVAGVFFTGMYEYDLKYVYVTLDSLTDFLDRGDVVDGIEVRIGSPDDTDAYVATLQRLLGKSFRVQDWKELNRSLFSALKLEKIAMFLVLGIVILVASFSIVGNLIMVVVEKAREIALIKTLGAADSNVMLVFAIQGLLIGVIGTGLGVVTGLGVCWILQTLGFPLNPDVYYIDKLPVHVDASSVMLTGAAGVLISMLATFYPAVVAARVRPAAGMRH